MSTRASVMGPMMSSLGSVPYEGGVPIMVDGKIIGAVGVSGMLPQQDEQVANAAAGAVK